MGERVPMTVRVDEDLKEEFDKFVKENYTQKRGAKSEAMEDALSAHMEYGTEARMESKLDETLTLVREMHDAHTHKQTETSSTNSPVRGRTEEIAELVYTLDKPVLKEKDVRDQIENYGYGDTRTKDEYLERLKRWGYLYEDPSRAAAWYVDESEWFSVVDAYLDRNPHSLDDILREYPEDVEQALTEYLESQAEEEPEEDSSAASPDSASVAVADGGDSIDSVRDVLEGNDGEAAYEVIVEVAESEGLPRDEVDDELREMRETGEVYCPMTDVYSLI